MALNRLCGAGEEMEPVSGGAINSINALTVALHSTTYCITKCYIILPEVLHSDYPCK